MKSKRTLYFVAVTAAIFLYIIYDSLSQSAGERFKGDFKELAFYRNEQNTGPVMRIYAVSVNDTLWTEMEAYGKTMPHNKYGNTKVYYFLKQHPMPGSLSPADGSFDKTFNEHCVAKFEKGAMGQTVLVKFPFIIEVTSH